MYIKKKKKKRLLDGHDPKWFQGFFRYSFGPDFFLYLVLEPFPSVFLCTLVEFLHRFSERRGGGGAVAEVFPRVGLFNLYQGHFKRYQENLGISPCGYPPSTG